MLKRVFMMISVALAGCFAAPMPSKGIKKVNDVKVDENVKASRAFSGRIEKIGFWKSFFSDYKYCLYDKDRCIACLDCKEKVRLPETLKAFVGKEVNIKGSPQYINKEPYLVITVDDVGKK